MAQTYNFKEVAVTLDGVPVSGFADGDAISIVQNDDLWSMVTGNDGTPARSRRNNSSARVTLTLLATAPANDFLMGKAKLDAETGLGQFSLQVRDIRGNSVHFSQDAWVVRIPDVTYSRDVGTREWMIDCGRLDNTVGGTNF